MRTTIVSAKITYYPIDELSTEDKKLLQCAMSATDTSYSPYSSVKVGASVLLDNGEIITGSNQENAAYPSGICAERVAIFQANARFPLSTPLVMAIAAKKGDLFFDRPITPCGACRQVLTEVEDRFHSPIRLLLHGLKEVAVIESIHSILPLSFDASEL